MIYFDGQRASDSPFVEQIWCSHSEGAHPFLSIAVSRLELVVSKLHGKITLTVRGPETQATPVGDSPAEGEWFGIVLKPGAFSPPLNCCITAGLNSFRFYTIQRLFHEAYYY
jgi:hypothetical protein